MSKINIFISCHKDFNVMNNDIFKPIQVGAELSQSKIEGILHDNDNLPNISEKNKMYCELTSHYYAWKHIDADFYGFFHYRRYLSFSEKRHKVNYENIIVEKELNNDVIKKYCLDEKSIHDMIEKYDLIIPERHPSIGSIQHAYNSATTQSRTDFKFCCDYVCKKYPEMKKSLKKYIHSWLGYYCNMFIMKKEIFNDYCTWLFDILEAHEKAFNFDHYDVQSYRVSGYLAERLTGAYITWLLQNKSLKVKKLQMIKFENCEKPQKNDEKTCNIVLKTSKNNFLWNNVLLSSIIQNTNENNKYKIVIHQKGLKEYQQNILKSYATKNCKIEIVKGWKNNFQYNFNKYIALDGNCLVNGDLYDLYCQETQTMFSGTNDANEIIKFGKTRLDRQSKKLRKNNPYAKINNSVLLVDKTKPNGNSVIDLKWNLPINCKYNYAEKLYSFASHTFHQKYVNAKKMPQIITFYGNLTPIHNDMVEFGDKFWQYAKSSKVFVSLMRYNYIHYKNIRKSLYDTLCPKGSPIRDAIRTYFKKY